MAAAVVVPPFGVVVALADAWLRGGVPAAYLWMVPVGWLLTGLGVTVGYHRLMAHHAFKTHRWLRNTLIGLGALSVQKSPLEWCAVHRKHHALSDQAPEPHSPACAEDGTPRPTLAGLWHAHVGWLFSDHLLSARKERYAPDLGRDAFVQAVHRQYETLWVPASLLLPALAGAMLAPWFAPNGSIATGAWLGFLWGGLVRIFVVHHITWSINSFCHVFGSRAFDTADHSRNNWPCALLAHGEGWHNNHHAFPASARHGLRWWQYDPSWWLIRALERLGLAWDVRLPSR